jgi:asparagine synthase (glutamine-hydrolysing)
MERFPGPYGRERAQAIDHPHQVAARERYDRVASSLAIEPRDPFLDRRLVDFSLRLPGEQMQWNGWPKVILRRALAGRLPDTVRWRIGKQHVGGRFNTELTGTSEWRRLNASLAVEERLAPYIDIRQYESSQRSLSADDGNTLHHQVWLGQHLAGWLDRHRYRLPMTLDSAMSYHAARLS